MTGTPQPESVSAVSDARTPAPPHRHRFASLPRGGWWLGVFAVLFGWADLPVAQDVERDRRDLLAEGKSLMAAGQFEKAAAVLERALAAQSATADRAGEAAVLIELGWARSALGRNAEALSGNERALGLCQQQTADARCEAAALTAVAHIHLRMGNAALGLEYFGRALPRWETLGDARERASALNEVGWIHWTTGETAKAIARYHEAIQVAQAAADPGGEGFARNNLGIVHAFLGEVEKARAFYEGALDLRRRAGAPEGQAQTLANLCNLHWRSGDYQRALDTCGESVRLARSVNDRDSLAWALDSIGLAYWSLGDPARALTSHHEALALRIAAGNRPGLAVTLNNIGWVHFTQGERAEARRFFTDALEASRSVGNPRDEAFALNYLGMSEMAEGDYPAALRYLHEALRLRRHGGFRREEAQTLHNIGRTLAATREPGAAVEHYQAALEIFRSVADRGNEANTLLALARLAASRGDLAAARTRAGEALTIAESLRAGVASVDMRTSYLATKQEYYDVFIDALMQLHARRPQPDLVGLALEASERARARSLLETLTEARADIREGVDPALLSRERAVRRTLDDRERARMSLLNRRHSAAEAEAAERELTRLVREYRDLQAAIRAASPRYAALTQPEPLSLREIQTEVLDTQSVLLEYRLGEARSYLWTVTPSSIRSYTLPGRAQIERAARRLYTLLVDSHQRAARAQTEIVAGELSAMLLGPAAREIAGKRVVVAADGILHFVPFAALADPNAGSVCPRDRRYCPLVAGHEVVSLPSASVLAAIRREAAARPRAPKTLAIFSDPVFDPADDRVSRRPATSGTGSFERLPFSRREADAIAALARRAETLRAVDFDASRAMLMRADLSQYRFVHFATHGVIDSARPELSGLVLSLVDRQGRAQEGFLRMHEIFNLTLGADLVVLSACRTALGAEIKGEGLVGLTRAFMYAGSPRVVASLWDVRDAATAELMTGFYKGMLAQGLSPTAALRAAQKEMWQSGRYDAPFYWAGFVLQGDWRAPHL